MEVAHMYKKITIRKFLPLLLAAGIICFAAYGIYHTASAYANAGKSQSLINMSLSQQSLPESTPGFGGSVCNPLGCAACVGCNNALSLKSIGTLPDSSARIEMIH
jgi:hypothetical protein